MLRIWAALAGTAMLVGEPTATVADRRVFPESITSTPDGALIVGGTATGALYRAGPRETVLTRWTAPAPGAPSGIFGVLADPARDTLWACRTGIPPGQTPTAIVRYRLSTGEALRSAPFPGGGFCNDLTLDRQGVVYATDIGRGRVIRMVPGQAPVEWIADPLLAGADGIVVHRGRVLVNSVRSGKLIAIPIAGDRPGTPAELALSRSLQRPDGMRLAGRDTLLVVEGVGRLASIDLSSKPPLRVTTLADGLVEPVGVTHARGAAQVVQGHISYVLNPELRGKDPGAHGIFAIPFKEPKR
ncbi:hypothetical protein [Sphingomonas sp. Y38-1Y]|uniref:SMP-30/gluconolactonase/LRE family protein n=1 Tax=Sphingomonas sp. Y38-1Y TaxID=3078265 RepID=UPI0028E37AFB|nr:hypothetical protein [Sphingomonas sp. Y38-1Y]